MTHYIDCPSYFNPIDNLEHYLDLGHAFFTGLGWKPGKLNATVDPGKLLGCHLVRNGNLCRIYLGLVYCKK